MNNKDESNLTKDINIEAAIRCYERAKKANANYRERHPEKRQERSKIDYFKMKTEHPEKWELMRQKNKERYLNDPDRKEKARQRYLKYKEKKEQTL